MKKKVKLVENSVNERISLDKAITYLSEVDQQIIEIAEVLKKVYSKSENAMLELDKLKHKDNWYMKKAIHLIDFSKKFKEELYNLQDESTLEHILNKLDITDEKDEEKLDVFFQLFGLDEQIKEIKRVLNPDRYKEGANILLHGPPGCGKSFIMKVLEDYANLYLEGSYHYLSMSDLRKKYVGEVEEKLKQVFEDSRKSKCTIICIDEVDSVVRDRDYFSQEHGQDVLNALLAEIHGLRGRPNKIITVSATNIPDVNYLDKAFIDRMNKIIYVPPPTEVSRLSYFCQKMHKNKHIEEDLDVVNYLDLTENWSYRQIDNLIEELICIAEESDNKLTDEILSNCVEKIAESKKPYETKTKDKYAILDVV
jgi:SpoVK/Ycf46/Vps4 family AAA+-type ATPase